MDRDLEKSDWARALKLFTERNAGRRTMLEVDGEAIGAQREETGLPLRGIAFDPRDGRVEIMLGEQADVERRVTRTISGVDGIAVTADDAGRDRALRVAHEGGQTVLQFLASAG